MKIIDFHTLNPFQPSIAFHKETNHVIRFYLETNHVIGSYIKCKAGPKSVKYTS